MSLISLFEIIRVVDEGRPEACIFFQILASIVEAAAVIPNGAKTCFAKVIATFVIGPANLLNNDPKSPTN